MQTREKVKGLWGDNDFEIAIGSNTGNKDIENCFAVGRIFSPNSTQWFHLKLEDVKRIIAKHEARKED